MVSLRPYQEKVDIAQREFMEDPDEFRAIVCACTGSGKTINYLKLIVDQALDYKSANLCMKVLIAQPRLALSEEQQVRAHEFICRYDLFYDFSSFHTGAIIEWRDQKQRVPKIPLGTTDVEDLEHRRDICVEDVHVTWTSYKSLHQVAHLDFDLIICDESHYLMQKKLRPNLDAFDKKTKVLFYTATPVGVKGNVFRQNDTDDDSAETTKFDDEDDDEDSVDPFDLGMKDTNAFGKIIADVPPKELIPLGYIVPPVIRLMDVETTGSGDIVDFAQMIGLAYKDQLGMEEVSAQFNHKMLVSMPGTKMFKDVMSNRSTISNEVGEPVDVYCVCSNWHAKNSVTPSAESRHDLVADFASSTNRAVILHYDTLAEGIDVDGIGGVLFLRQKLGKVKGLQTIGRACRPARSDIMADGNIRLSNRAKTHAILTLAEVDGKTVSERRLEEWSLFFEEGGYNHLWAYVPREGGKTGTHESKDGKPLEKRYIKIAWFTRTRKGRAQQLRLKYNLPLKTSKR